MFKYLPSEVRPDLLGINSLNPFDTHGSSSRRQMHASHLTQALTLKKGDIKRIQSGMEREYGKYTFSVKMPVSAKILKIVHLYRKTLSYDSIKRNPQVTLIYEDVKTKEIGILELNEFFSNHQYFGFSYVASKAMQDLTVGSYIEKDTVLLDSPAKDPQGNYKYGLELNVALMSHPATAEDGIVISESTAKRLQIETFETRTVEWGGKNFPLNIYGNEEKFQGFPDIGEMVRPDGLLMCLREYDESLAVIQQSVRSMMQVNHSFDKCVYSSPGEIVDIRIHHDQSGDSDDPAFSMDEQAEKYYKSKKQYLQDVLAFWKTLCREKGGHPKVTPKFKNLLIEAMVELDTDKQRIEKTYKNNKIDTWRVTFTIKNTLTPTKGFKITDQSGGKH